MPVAPARTPMGEEGADMKRRLLAVLPLGLLAALGGWCVAAPVPAGRPKEFATLKGHALGALRAVAFAPGGTIVATASDDKTVKLWEVNTGKCLHTLKGHT